MNRPVILVAVLVVAFGAAFGIGKATAGGSDDSGGSKQAAKADVAPSEVDAPELSTAGNLPALRVKRSTPAAGGGGGGGGSSSGQAATQPSTPSAALSAVRAVRAIGALGPSSSTFIAQPARRRLRQLLMALTSTKEA